MRYPMIREGYVLSPTRDYIRKTNLDSHDTTTPKSLPYRFPTCFGRLKWNQLSLDERKEKNKLGVDLLPSKMLETTGRHVERYKKVKYTVSSSAGQLANHLFVGICVLECRRIQR